MTEQWKPVVGFEDRYEVSDQGRVRTICVRLGKGTRRKPIFLAQGWRNGYLRVSLSRNDLSPVAKFVHCVVAEAFIGPRPTGYHCCHINDVRSDNTLANLKWATPRENYDDRARNGGDMRGEKNGRATITKETAVKIKLRLNAGDAVRAIAEDLGVTRTVVTNIQHGLGWAWLEI